MSALAGSPLGVATNPESLSMDPQGRFLYAANAGAPNQVASYSIEPASGTLTQLSVAAAGALPVSIVVDPSGQFIYAANYNSNNVSAYTVDAGGVLTAVPGSPFAAGAAPHAIAID